MTEFLRDLCDPDLAFLRYALIMGALASVSFGMIGSYVVARRISYIAGAISHSMLGGIGACLYLQHNAGQQWCDPMYGAVASALASALIIGLVSLYARQREDTVIGAIWAVGMAVGFLFLYKTRSYADPMVWLAGDILLVGKRYLWLVAGLDALVIAIGTLYYNKLLAVCFDEEFARVRGIKVELYYLLLLCLTALTVALLVPVVGIVMVIALLTLPAGIAGMFSRKLWQMILLAIFLCLLFSVGGISLSYAPDLPSGPVIIVIAGVAYLGATALHGVVKRKSRQSNQ